MLPATALVALINCAVIQPRVVQGQSMEPSLSEDERVIVDLVTYRLRVPQRGEIIILDPPSGDAGPPLIKRIIGLPGDMVAIRSGAVYVNGDLLDEPYLDQLTFGEKPAQLVPEEHVFVLGDNREASNDSRYFGMVPYESLRGRAILRYWPVKDVCLFSPTTALADAR